MSNGNKETVVDEFSRTVPQWRPRVTPVDLDRASPEQLDALKVTPSNTKVSHYLRVLAHDPEILKVRSPLFNQIMYAKGGLSRAERELGATGASIVNHCIYCAAVHADRHQQLTRDDEVTDRLFAAGEDVELEPRNQAIVDFAIKLSKAPSEATTEDLQRLADQGLSGADAVDLVLASALFGWANRLMHVLGDPVQPTDD